MKNQNRIFKLIASVSGLIVIDKILGFIKQIIMASTFGATTETDIINLAQSAVTDIQYILAQALITAFISIYIYTQQENNESANKSLVFAGDSIKVFLLISFCLTIVFCFSSGVLSRILAPSYNNELNRKLSQYIRIYSILLVFFALNCIFVAILNANKKFIPEQLVSFNQSIIIIVISVLCSTIWGPNSLVIAFFVSTIWNTFFLGILCRKYVAIKLNNPLDNPNIKQLFKMIIPLLLGYSLIYINQMVDRMLVSGLGPGVITALSYGSVLSNFVTTFIATFCNIVFSYITTEISAGDYRSASAIVGVSVKVLSVLFMPFTLTFIICSQEIVSIVYGRGAFDEKAVVSAALALKGYAIMFVPVIIREIYSKYQYAFQDSRSPMMNGSIGIGANIIFSIVFCHYWGVFGVALATSLSVLINAVLNMITAKKKTEELQYSFLKKFSVKFLAISIFSFIAGAYLYKVVVNYYSLFKIVIVFFCCIFIFAIFFSKEIITSIKELKKYYKIIERT